MSRKTFPNPCTNKLCCKWLVQHKQMVVLSRAGGECPCATEELRRFARILCNWAIKRDVKVTEGTGKCERRK